jgi:hypothetical protein
VSCRASPWASAGVALTYETQVSPAMAAGNLRALSGPLLNLPPRQRLIAKKTLMPREQRNFNFVWEEYLWHR